MAIAIAMALAVFAGALLQRVSGLGFALVASPFLALVAGPYEGILLSNLLGIVVSLTVLATTWRDVELSRAAILVPAGLIGVLPGVAAARWLPPRPLEVTVGLLVIAGLLATVLGSHVELAATLTRTTALGLVSGFMTATAGVGGPALTVYALATRWRQAAFAATAQISFAAQAIAALALKGLPRLPWAVLAALAVAAGVGLAAGHLLARWLPAVYVRRTVIGIAFLGAAAAVVKGLLDG